jgi:5-hydroxyisourate hydrolase-like protein (transthyretin family)
MAITVNVIDCMNGRAAEGVKIKVEYRTDSTWRDLATGETDGSGQLSDWHPEFTPTYGIYRLELDIDGYFASLGSPSFYAQAMATFRVIDPAAAYQVSVLVTPYMQLMYQYCC